MRCERPNCRQVDGWTRISLFPTRWSLNATSWSQEHAAWQKGEQEVGNRCCCRAWFRLRVEATLDDRRHQTSIPGDFVT